MKNKKGFTLAEVLITLGIAGVVAAMTLPAVIQNYRNNEVEVKLQKIYSVMNQAIKRSEVDNGPKEYWTWSCSKDEEGNPNENCKQGFDKYFRPYLKIFKTKEFMNASSTKYNYAVWFLDGSVLVFKQEMSSNAFDLFFFPNAKNFDEDTFFTSSSGRKDCGTTYFAFRFAPNGSKGFEPYKDGLSGTITKEKLTSSHRYACTENAYYKVWCTALIQLNGWKIPDDYPFKVK